MENPLTALRLPLTRVQPIRRAFVYSLLVVALLGYASFRWIYSHPRQVEIRLENSLSETLSSGVRVHGAVYGLGKGTRAQQISIDTPEIATGGPVLARLRGVHVDTSEVSCTGAGGSSVVQHGAASDDARRVVLCSASVLLEHADAAPTPDLVDWSGGWNVAGLFRDGALEETLEEAPLVIDVRRLETRWRLLRGGDQRVARDIEATGVRIEARDGRVWMSARLPECSFWEEGQIELSWSPGDEWALVGRIDNFQAAEDWTPFLPAGHGRLWALLRPTGETTLEFRRLGWTSTAAGDSGSVDLDLRWHHYDTTLRLPRVDVALTSINGVLRVDEDGIDFGGETSTTDDSGSKPTRPSRQQTVRAKIWGQPCRLSGQIDTRGAGEVRCAISDAALTTMLAARAPEPLAGLLRALRPYGGVAGLWTIFVGAQEERLWEATLTLTDVAFARFAAIGCQRIELRSLQAHRPAEGEGAHSGAGRVELGGLDWSGLGRLVGQLAVRWDDDGLAAELDGVSFSPTGDPSTRERRRERRTNGTDSKASRREGKVRGSVARAWSDGAWTAKLDWDDVALFTPVLEVDGSMGTFASPPSREAEGDTGRAVFATGVVPPMIVGEDAFGFESGNCRWRLTRDGLHIDRLDLVGRRGALRATGTVRLDGALDVVVVRVGPLGKERLGRLPRDATPRDWFAPTEILAKGRDDDGETTGGGGEAGVGEKVRDRRYEPAFAYRVSGTVAAPQSRPIHRTDPAFSAAAGGSRRP